MSEGASTGTAVTVNVTLCYMIHSRAQTHNLLMSAQVVSPRALINYSIHHHRTPSCTTKQLSWPQVGQNPLCEKERERSGQSTHWAVLALDEYDRSKIHQSPRLSIKDPAPNPLIQRSSSTDLFSCCLNPDRHTTWRVAMARRYIWIITRRAPEMLSSTSCTCATMRSTLSLALGLLRLCSYPDIMEPTWYVTVRTYHDFMELLNGLPMGLLTTISCQGYKLLQTWSCFYFSMHWRGSPREHTLYNRIYIYNMYRMGANDIPSSNLT